MISRPYFGKLSKLAGPIIVGQIGVVLVSFVDTFMVGHYGVNELAAASFVNNVTMILIIAGLGFAMGLSPLVSDAVGRGNRFKAGALLKAGLKTNGILAFLVALILSIIYFNLDKMGQPAVLMPLIKNYFIIVSFSILTTFIFNTFKQFTDATMNTSVSMIIIITSNIINIIGNYVLIYGKAGFPELGLMGAGISTFIARLYAVIAMTLYFLNSSKMSEYKKGFRYSRENKIMMKDISRIGMPVCIQMLMESASFSLIIIMVGWLGTTELAAHQVMATISQLCFTFYIAVGNATSILISNYNGQGMKDSILSIANTGYIFILCITIISNGFILISFNELVSLFTDSANVKDMTSLILLPFVLSQFGDGLQICFSNSLRGIQQVKPILPIAFISYIIISLPVSYLLGFIFEMGLRGIWFGYPISLTFAGILYYLTFRKFQKTL